MNPTCPDIHVKNCVLGTVGPVRLVECGNTGGVITNGRSLRTRGYGVDGFVVGVDFYARTAPVW